MKLFTTRKELSAFLKEQKKDDKSIGFVPTMGALHKGHLSLIENAKNRSDLVICSIFVNPTQFNDPKDLERYPRPIDSDIQKLKDAGCDILFLPEVKEMYGENEHWHINLGNLENVLEGKFRPDHYQGVTQIVKKLFDVVEPDSAFFGQKDFQQFLVIKHMVNALKTPVELIMCPIVREYDGLAMSSRNIHLSPEERQESLALYKALKMTEDNVKSKSLSQLKEDAEAYLKDAKGVKLEYFEICDAETLLPASENTENIIALVAAYLGKTRLIDNLILK